MAKLAAVAVVGVVATHPPELPAGPYPVLLHESEDLAREWTVAVLTPRFGAERRRAGGPAPAGDAR
ncbi:hypothetical protein AB0C29_43415 [Actinoplanes sp. NPDC048791]|uniref:hypothetical protein n=1 Tax=Actinoplanes sp. NPDC048791 TaxID=3154623 RepID=UPI0033ED70E6